MKTPFDRWTVATFLLFLTVLCAHGAGERNSFDPLQFTTGDFHGCPPQGRGQQITPDPYLCSLKNRDKPPTSARLYTVERLYKLTPRLPNRPVHRSKWTPQQQDLAAKWEQGAVMVEGYLLGCTAEGQEACNCGSTQYIDHHLWLAPSPSSAKTRAMVVEISPRTWDAHPTWSNTATFQKLVTSKTKVRVAGWLTWDQEHQAQVGHSRRTLWEVHPVHSIQVQSGGQWVPL